MAKSKQAKANKKQEKTVQQPTPPAHDASDEGSDVEFVTEGGLEKDEAEEELERLVFGDSEGFREGLRDFNLDDAEVEEGEDESASEDGLAGMDDADVCATTIIPLLLLDSADFCYSSSSPILHLPRTLTKHQRTPTTTNRLQSNRQHGRTATTSDL